MLLLTPKEQLVEYGQRMRSHRIRLKMTQQDLARDVGVATHTISRFERGENISLDLFLRILLVLGIDRELLLEPEITTLSDLRLRGKPEPQRYKPCKTPRKKKYPIFA